MPDEPAPEVQDQPTPDPSVEEPGSNANEGEAPEFDPSALPPEAQSYLKNREKELQGVMTRRTQEAAEERKQYEAVFQAASDPSHPQHAEALQVLGLEVAEDDKEELDPEDALRTEVEGLKQYLAQQEQSEVAKEIERLEREILEEEIGKIETTENISFSKEERQVVENLADRLRDEDGIPDVPAAYDLLKKAFAVKQKEWASSKRAPRAPGSGPAAHKQFDINDSSQRLEAAVAAAEAAGAE